MTIEKINWKSHMSFGKYNGIEIRTAFMEDKEYFQWCIENDLNLTKPEIEFVRNKILEQRMNQGELF